MTLTEEGWTCECQDFIARKKDKGELCKHLNEMAESGLLGRKQS